MKKSHHHIKTQCYMNKRNLVKKMSKNTNMKNKITQKILINPTL